jgi:uncharacterized membrane protein YccC
MQRIRLFLRLTVAALLLVSVILFFIGKDAASVTLLSFSLFCFAIIVGLQLSNYLHQRTLEQRRK